MHKNYNKNKINIYGFLLLNKIENENIQNTQKSTRVYMKTIMKKTFWHQINFNALNKLKYIYE